MPDKRTLARVKKDQEQGRSASTQAGEFVRETIDHIREGKHGAKNAKQAIAIGLAKARRAGVAIPAKGKSAAKTTTAKPAKKAGPVSKTRSRAVTRALKKMPKAAASKTALSRQTKAAAKKRGPANRQAAARKAARTRKEQGTQANGFTAAT